MSDFVDDIQQAWARERPGTPVASIGVITRIWRIARLLEEDRRATMTELGMDVPTRNLLSTLRRVGSPYSLTATEIAGRAGVSAGAVSQWIARCEREGLVKRSRGKTDGRTVLVTLTARGQSTIDAVVDELLRHEEDLVATLTPAEIDRLSSLLRKLMADLE